MDFSEIKELKSIFTQKKFCYPISELDNDGGYADIFLSPLCDIYKIISVLPYLASSVDEENEWGAAEGGEHLDYHHLMQKKIFFLKAKYF